MRAPRMTKYYAKPSKYDKTFTDDALNLFICKRMAVQPFLMRYGVWGSQHWVLKLLIFWFCDPVVTCTNYSGKRGEEMGLRRGCTNLIRSRFGSFKDRSRLGTPCSTHEPIESRDWVSQPDNASLLQIGSWNLSVGGNLSLGRHRISIGSLRC